MNIDESPRCKECDVPLVGQAVGGLCANCLLKLALEPPVEAPALTDEPGEEITVETAAPREAVGSRIGRYKLLQEIGEGGFGIVYLADQLEPVKRRVALKVLKPGMDTREVVARFEAERQALALMDHPNIARVFDGGATESGRPYFVMELVKGIPLTKYCDDHELNTRQRLDLFLDVLAAVQHAHQKGIIHRDLKPANILVSPHDGRPVIKVIDFGIAKAISLELTDKTLFTAHGRMIGTPQYMSPEQAEINALDVDTRSDLYSLGVILYELLTGRTPLDAKKLRAAAYAEIQRLIREEEPPKPSTRLKQEQTAMHQPGSANSARRTPHSAIDQDLDWIVMKALEKDRARRYETANGFASDLRRHLENQPVMARPPGAGYLLSRFMRRHKFGFAAGAAVALSLVAGIAAAVWGMARAETARKAAEVETTKTKLANEANKQNLHLASMADYASAVKAFEEDSDTTIKGERAIGFGGKSRWHEGVVLMTRSLERALENTAAALDLYEFIRSRQAEKRDWPFHILKHDGMVWSASFSSDGGRVVTASGPYGEPGYARIWNAATGEAIGQPMRHEARVYSASFSPDGTRIVTASGDLLKSGYARMWDALTGSAIGEPMHHEAAVGSACFSTDGTRIVTASSDKTARVWDAETGQTVGQPMRHEAVVLSASFSLDGAMVVTASGDETARVWDAVTGQAIGQPMRHGATVKSANFSPLGIRVVTASADRTARVWDAVTGHAIGQPMSHEAVVRSASFSPDGTKVLTASGDKTARMWDAETGQTIGQPLRHQAAVLSASFSPDGSRVVTASTEGTAWVWNVMTGQAIGQPMCHEAPVWSASFSPDGTKVLTASGEKTARIWDAESGQTIGRPMRHQTWMWSASFSPDGTTLIAASSVQTAQIWDVASGQTIGRLMRHEADVWRASFSPDSSKVVTVSGLQGKPGNAQIWNAVTGHAIGLLLPAVWSASFSSDGTRVVTASGDKTAQVWDSATGQTVGQPMRHDAAVLSADFSPDGARVVTASSNKTAQVWDSTTGRPLGEPMTHNSYVYSANFSADGTKVLTASGDKTAQIWDAATGQAIGQSLGHETMEWNASFSLDATKVVTASGDRTTQIWAAATGHAVGQPIRHQAAVRSAGFSPDSTKVVTASDDATARVWDAGTGHAIGQAMRHEAQVISASVSPDGTRVVTASTDKTARVWDVKTGQAISQPMRHEAPLRNASFSPDGTRVLTVTYAGVWRILTIVEFEAIPAMTPEILAWARNLSGLRFSENGELHLIPDDERIAAITNPGLPAGPWADLAKWINTPVPFRTIDPKSKITLRQIAERERDFDGDGTVESLESALRCDSTVPLARLFLAAALEKADAAKEAKDRESSLTQRAAFLRRYDLDALARETDRMKNEDLAGLWVRAANHLLELPADTKIGVGPKVTTAREEAANAARKALELVPGLPAAEAVLKKF